MVWILFIHGHSWVRISRGIISCISREDLEKCIHDLCTLLQAELAKLAELAELAELVELAAWNQVPAILTCACPSVDETCLRGNEI